MTPLFSVTDRIFSRGHPCFSMTTRPCAATFPSMLHSCSRFAPPTHTQGSPLLHTLKVHPSTHTQGSPVPHTHRVHARTHTKIQPVHYFMLCPHTLPLRMHTSLTPLTHYLPMHPPKQTCDLFQLGPTQHAPGSMCPTHHRMCPIPHAHVSQTARAYVPHSTCTPCLSRLCCPTQHPAFVDCFFPTVPHPRQCHWSHAHDSVIVGCLFHTVVHP